MNHFQELWWQQARSDYEAFVFLRGKGIARCHSLHYLQMTTEKLSKAYLWRSGSPPRKSHGVFVQFLRLLGSIQSNHRERIAKLFLFGRYEDFQKWISTIQPIAHKLQQLAPNLAGDGPNPEYPWPHAEPKFAPVNHDFDVWKSLTTGQGRNLMRVIKIAVNQFPEYTDV